MKKIGITGGIGSGKTYICEYFKKLGIPVFNSDNAARQLEKHPDIQKGFKEILGDDIFINGVLDRVKMRSIVFTDESKLKQINTLVIPYIKEMFEKFCEVNSNFPYCIFESAIIFETKSESYFDKIITVSADMWTRMNRAMKRDNSSVKDIENKFRVQTSDLQKESLSHFVIKNDGDKDVSPQVNEIHREILREIGIKKDIIDRSKIKKVDIKQYPEIDGLYKHYKGGKYKVLSLAKHSETDEIMVVYRSIHFGSVHVRPLSMWFNLIELGTGVPPIERFKLIKLNGSNNQK